MPYSIRLMTIVSCMTLTAVSRKGCGLDATGTTGSWDDLADSAKDRLAQLIEKFAAGQVTPAATHAFEQDLEKELRELGRQTVQWTLNRLEPPTAELPKHAHFDGTEFTRLNRKAPQNAWCLFGAIRLQRVGFRPTDKSSGESTIFPLAMSLGLTEGATPALADRVGRMMGEGGSNQRHVLRRLKSEHAVGWGTKKLRDVTEAVSEAVTMECHEVQVGKLLELLEKAWATTGRHKPVLSAGRDGITLGMRGPKSRTYRVASVCTVAVLDRRGKRLGTIYLAQSPELGQATMSARMTHLLSDTLKRWTGMLPRLCYVTDSGDNETSYYDRVLSVMVHPRDGTKLEWLRVADFYHASERVWKMSELLFGKGWRATSWARKMLKLMLKPGGVNRVLHSAAALRDRQKLNAKKLGKFATAYAYLRDRLAYMQYADYRRVGMPLGSGVTEAACKTVFTQRLKQSGMTWEHAGSQTILNLRVLLLSGTWEAAFQRTLANVREPHTRSQTGSQTANAPIHEGKAA